MSKVTENQLEDRSSQWEVMKRSVELPTARVVDAHRVQYQRWWTATVRHLIGVDVRCMKLSMEIETVIDIATPRRWLKSSEDWSLLQSCESAQLLAYTCLQSLV